MVGTLDLSNSACKAQEPVVRSRSSVGDMSAQGMVLWASCLLCSRSGRRFHGCCLMAASGHGAVGSLRLPWWCRRTVWVQTVWPQPSERLRELAEVAMVGGLSAEGFGALPVPGPNPHPGQELQGAGVALADGLSVEGFRALPVPGPLRHLGNSYTDSNRETGRSPENEDDD